MADNDFPSGDHIWLINPDEVRHCMQCNACKTPPPQVVTLRTPFAEFQVQALTDVMNLPLQGQVEALHNVVCNQQWNLTASQSNRVSVLRAIRCGVLFAEMPRRGHSTGQN